MANTLKFGNGQWATKVGSTLAYNDEGGNFKPLPFNFTRSTSATRVNKDGLIKMVTNNKPRIDFLNDSNGALLLEPQRTNLLPHSEFMTASNWQGGQTTANVILSSNLSPEGKANCYQVTRSSSGTSQVGIFTGITNGSTYTGSIYVRSISGSLSVSFRDVNGAGTTKSITTDWTRIDVTATASSTTGRLYLVLVADGDVVEVYGAQLEEGSYATSYIPTQGGAVTRNADVISKTGISDLINGESGTLFLNSASLANDGTIKYFSINNGTTGYEIVFQYTSTSNTVGIRYINGGFAQCDDSVLITNALDFNKFAFTWQLNKFELWCNGIKVISDTSGSVTTGFNQIDFRRSNGTIPFFSKVKSVALYNTALTDQELINLTTI